MKNARILSREIKYLQMELSKYTVAKDDEIFDRCVTEPHEVREALERIEQLAN